MGAEMTTFADRDPLHREIAQLREHVEYLTEQLRAAREDLAPLPNRFPAAWKLEAGARRFLAVLMRLSPQGASRETLTQACAQTNDPDEIDSKLADVYACKLRKALRRHVPGAQIETVWGEGYRLPAASKALIEAAIEAAQ
jgi:DNA-binding response OmpR family regulator